MYIMVFITQMVTKVMRIRLYSLLRVSHKIMEVCYSFMGHVLYMGMAVGDIPPPFID